MRGPAVRELEPAGPESRDDYSGMVALGRTLYGGLGDSYDFASHELIVDVGGTLCHVLLDLLERFPLLRAIAFDRPNIMPHTRERVSFSRMNLRCLCLGGDASVDIPQGGDAYLLTSVLRDCGDDGAHRILRNVRRAIARGGVLLVGERLIEPCRGGGLTPLLPAGRERTREELARLFGSAGFLLRDVRPLPSYASLLIADPLEGTFAAAAAPRRRF